MVLSQVINSAFSLDPVKQSKVFLIFYYGDKSCQIAVKKIHQTRGKFPKPMNHPADQGLKDNYSGEKKRRGIFQRLMARPFLVLGWIAVGIACLLLAIFVLYPHRTAPASPLSDLKTRPEVFRIKIPEEIKIEQNLFRRKIPDIDQVVKLLTKFDFVERNQLLEQNEIAYYQTIFKDKPWFQLLYGIYATKKDAQAAADNLPLKIRKSSPWIRRLSAVQKAIRRKAAQ